MNALIGSLAASVAFRDPRRRAYFMIGAGAYLVLLIFWMSGIKLRALLPASASFWWSVATGLTLLGCILTQWLLFFARLTGNAEKSRRHYAIHRIVGAVAIVLFVLHAGAFGYAFVTILALAFATIAFTGLFNKEVVVLRAAWLRTAWEIGHIGLSGILLPLIVLHMWAALAFK